MRPVLRQAVVLVWALVLLWSSGASAGGAPVHQHVYAPPVDAPVVDPFRPPDQPWLAGNRGLEYDTVPGTVVRAIGPGLVVFAGPVAGHLYVTVLHGDGIRSSYSYLAAISVSRGDRVRGGQPVGISGAVRFHLGARVGSTYIDPAGLFGTAVGEASVFLVPLGGGAGPSPPGPDGATAAPVPPRAPGGAVRGVGAALAGAVSGSVVAPLRG